MTSTPRMNMTTAHKNISKKIILSDKDYSNVLVIIPSYNEAKNIEKTVTNLKKIGNVNFLIVDDCSTDNTQEIIQKNKWNSIRNEKNLKLTKTFKVGVQYAVDNGYRYVIQYDGDGQHESSSIPEMIYFANKGYDIVLGSRYMTLNHNIDNHKKFAHKILRSVFFMKTMQKISDPTCGLRLYNWQAMHMLLKNEKLQPEPASLAYFIKKEKMKIKEIPTIVHDRSDGSSIFDIKKHVIRYMLSQIWHTLFLPRKVSDE